MPLVSDPVEQFAAGLRCSGTHPEHRGALIVYEIDVIDGRYAGEAVLTAVEIAELAHWPVVPPHWVHLPADVRFARTNSQPSPLTAWLRHSRQIADWGRDPDPAQAWLAHIRSVVGEAQ